MITCTYCGPPWVGDFCPPRGAARLALAFFGLFAIANILYGVNVLALLGRNINKCTFAFPKSWRDDNCILLTDDIAIKYSRSLKVLAPMQPRIPARAERGPVKHDSL